VQHACGITNATGIQSHIDNLLLHLRGWSRVGILQEKRPPASQATLPASIPLLAFSGHAMAYNICPVTVGTMQHLRHHGIPIPSWSLSSSHRGYQINRSETPSPHQWSSLNASLFVARQYWRKRWAPRYYLRAHSMENGAFSSGASQLLWINYNYLQMLIH